MSLVAAIFVVVVLGALALFAVRIGAAGQQDVNTELMGARALAAARAGFEFAAYRTLSVPPTQCLAHPAMAVVRPYALNLTQGSLTGFTATVNWDCRDHLLNGIQYQTFHIDVLAQRGPYGTADYVARRLSKTVTNAP
jgi:hypothetical protein